jgi:hypothetical protein
MDADLAAESFDVDYFFQVTGKGEADFATLSNALTDSLSLRIMRVTEEHDVWVTRAPNPHLEVGNGPQELRLDSGKYCMRNVDFPRVIRSLEARYKILIDDETELRDLYNFSYPIEPDFEKPAKYLATEYGLQFSKERRRTTFVNIVRVPAGGEEKTRNRE